MKKLLGTLIALNFALIVSAQFTLKGLVFNQQTNQPVEAATISILKDDALITNSVTASDGSFEVILKKAGMYKVVANHISLQKTSRQVDVNSAYTNIQLQLLPSAYYLEPLEVRAVRASDKAPFTKLNLNKQFIEKRNLGQDLPILFDQTPSAVVSSDAGNGVGYTGLRIRGSDASRINVTINGIPYNDAESQGSYFVDLPDIASSINSIQIQRGVGTSSNGSGAFGATINLSTNEFNEQAYGTLSNSIGSFNTFKNTLRVGSGLINDHFTLNARLSRITSDGYIDRAATNLQSFYVSAAWLNKTSTLRFNILSGKEKTYQAWYGVNEDQLKNNRTYNPAGTEKPGEPYDNETDNYQQDHYQLLFNHAFSSKLSFNTALFLSRGKGYYEQYKAGQRFTRYGLTPPVINGSAVTNTDLVRQLWLDNYYYGDVMSLQYKTGKDVLTLGGGWNRYDGGHYGKVIWAQVGIPKDYRFYNLDAYKTDVNVYSKWQHALSNHLETFADLQYRSVRHNMMGFRNNPTVFVNRTFNFFNPKAGFTYTNKGWQAYLSYAVGNKEPNRDDFEAGVNQQPRHETLHNIETGVERKTQFYSLGANVYYMNYRNQLVLTGKINDVGAYTRQNIPQSYRLGIELQGSVIVSPMLNVAANMAFSRNKIKKFTEYVDNYDTDKQKEVVYNNVDISFSPSIIGGATLNILPCKNTTLSLISKYVSRQYLDNTQNESRSLDPYFVEDVRFNYIIRNKLFKELSILAQVNNIFNKKYAPNGYTFSYIAGGAQTTENYYFPMATTNFMAGLNIGF